MVRRRYFLFLTLLMPFVGGCATAQRGALPLSVVFDLPAAEKSEERVLENGLRVKYHVIKYANISEFESAIESRRNYLLRYFKESFDPYYGKDKWSSDCLNQNQFQPLQQEAAQMSFRAVMTVDRFWNKGYCGLDREQEVFLVCGNRKSLMVFTVEAQGSYFMELRLDCQNQDRSRLIHEKP